MPELVKGGQSWLWVSMVVQCGQQCSGLLWPMVVKSGSWLIKSGYVWSIGVKLFKAVNFCVCCWVEVNLCLNVEIT